MFEILINFAFGFRGYISNEEMWSCNITDISDRRHPSDRITLLHSPLIIKAD